MLLILFDHWNCLLCIKEIKIGFPVSHYESYTYVPNTSDVSLSNDSKVLLE